MIFLAWFFALSLLLIVEKVSNSLPDFLNQATSDPFQE